MPKNNISNENELGLIRKSRHLIDWSHLTKRWSALFHLYVLTWPCIVSGQKGLPHSAVLHSYCRALPCSLSDEQALWNYQMCTGIHTWEHLANSLILSAGWTDQEKPRWQVLVVPEEELCYWSTWSTHSPCWQTFTNSNSPTTDRIQRIYHNVNTLRWRG